MTSRPRESQHSRTIDFKKSPLYRVFVHNKPSRHTLNGILLAIRTALNKKETCSVCFEPFTAATIIGLACAHVFCYTCMTKWENTTMSRSFFYHNRSSGSSSSRSHDGATDDFVIHRSISNYYMGHSDNRVHPWERVSCPMCRRAHNLTLYLFTVENDPRLAGYELALDQDGDELWVQKRPKLVVTNGISPSALSNEAEGSNTDQPRDQSRERDDEDWEAERQMLENLGLFNDEELSREVGDEANDGNTNLEQDELGEQDITGWDEETAMLNAWETQMSGRPPPET